MSVSVVREVGGQEQRQSHQSVSPGGGDDELQQLRSRWRPRWTDHRREFSFTSLNTPAEGLVFTPASLFAGYQRAVCCLQWAGCYRRARCGTLLRCT